MVGARTYAPSGLPASTLGAAAFHDPVRDGSGWVHRASRTPLVQGAAYQSLRSSSLRCFFVFIIITYFHHTGSHREALAHAHASPLPVARPPARTAFPVISRGAYQPYSCEVTHLGGPFPLRCFQRFWPPNIATEPAGRPTTPPPAVRPRRSSRTERSAPQSPKRP